MDIAMQTSNFAYISRKHQSDQELLDRLSSSILALKMDAQSHQAQPSRQVSSTRNDLVRFLRAVMERVHAVVVGSSDAGIQNQFTGLADRFITVNPHDVRDRLDEVERLCVRLSELKPLRPQDFTALDDLQTLLEEEAVDNVRGLFRF